MTQRSYISTFIKTIMLFAVVMQVLKAKLEAKDYTGLTKDDIIGDLLYATALSYFAEMDAMDHVTAKTMGIENVRLPSEAVFSYELDTIFIFDSPMYVSSGGLAMDIDRDVTASVPLDGDRDKLTQFVLASGMNGSALEHAVPEQMFSTPENSAEGISAVKALQIANDQGIPIYTVNRTNIGTVLPQLEVSPSVKTNIVNAVNAGMVVTVPKTNITYNGWTGVGYIIINPDTGAGAYMIGGLSGGVMLLSVLNWLISLFSVEAAAIEPYKDIYADFPDTQCLNEGIYKCGKEAVMQAVWNLYFPIIELACLLIFKNPLACAVLGGIVMIISFGLSLDELGKCLDSYEKKCSEQPPQ